MSQKRGHGGGAPGVNLGLIITPMLDMSFQILAFFIMTYHPSALEGHIPGSLVPSEVPSSNPNQPVDPRLDPLLSALEDPMMDTILVRVKSTSAGTPRQIFLQLPLETEALLVADVDVDFAVALKRLETQLKDRRKKNVGGTNLKIVGDGELRQQYVMMVYDVCRNRELPKPCRSGLPRRPATRRRLWGRSFRHRGRSTPCCG